ncbi:MAG: zf-HC2 domain-containing protein [Bacteroidales bacterium]|nr:zf-HC2 domain-containing protein [Bacteroidales bacterium]
MNCALCQKYLEAWLAGTLPDHLKIQVEDHLSVCPQCRKTADVLKISETLIAGEKETEPNPFLATRIMAAIEANESRIELSKPGFVRLLRPAVIALSMATAVFAGIALGRLSGSSSAINEIPMELVLINDAQMEAIGPLSNE